MLCVVLRLDVSLKCANDDVGLHFGADFNRQTITLNSKLNGSWGEEERLPLGPLGKHSECDLTIRIKKGKFLVGLGGVLHGEFGHRLPRERIDQYDVSGIDNLSVEFPHHFQFGAFDDSITRRKHLRTGEYGMVSPLFFFFLLFFLSIQIQIFRFFV